ncbi:MAG: TIGR01777 family protein, partial [Chloroflexi bacterium]|nr:TIGR01777 family protein [Chloroflexota bacterium]
MKIIMTGSTGFLGSALVESLQKDGHQVVRLVREGGASGTDAVFWNPLSGIPDTSALEGADAVFHLAGENIVDGRWTAERKLRIRDSRVIGTRTLAAALSELENRPEVMVCASAVGFYGVNPDGAVTEDSPSGEDWLAQVCVEWESAAALAEDADIRTVFMRMGIVLHPSGGMLKRVLLPFRLGLGGRLGKGTQPMSWITLRDAVSAFRFVSETDGLSGPVNLSAPENSTNIDFTVALG